jgi:hypothetical protein
MMNNNNSLDKQMNKYIELFGRQKNERDLIELILKIYNDGHRDGYSEGCNDTYEEFIL